MSTTISLDSSAALQEARHTVRQDGPHRFVTADGRTGYQPLSRTTELTIDTDVLTGPEWSLGIWVCPLEDLDVAAPLDWILTNDPDAQRYPLVTDGSPTRDLDANVFGWYWLSQLRPAMLAKVVEGTPTPRQQPPASAQVEHLPLEAGTWYRMLLTYSQPEHRLCIWVNGVLAGISDFEFTADRPGSRLYVGNPAMAFADLTLVNRPLDAAEVGDDFATAASPRSRAAADRLRPMFEIQPPRLADWSPGRDWTTALQATFTDPADLDGWVLHGCQQPPHQMKAMETTPEGLLLHTPDEVTHESRMYLWSPQSFEGDIAIEVDFRVEQDSGFGMLVTQASGMQREDFLTDHPERNTGAMEVIARNRVRNYYWGFFRRTPTTPKHVASHTLVKNPWVRNLALAASEPLSVGTWHRLLFVQEGNRLRGALDGEWVVEGYDDPNQNHGPVFNSGRIALRLMYQTRMRFRDLRVWNRPTRAGRLPLANGVD